jgi:hypothetical protein
MIKKKGNGSSLHWMGDLLAIENYRWGNKNGRCMYYNPFVSQCVKKAGKQ